MYGFGDEQHPRADSIKVMEEMVLEYIIGLVTKVSQNIVARQRSATFRS